MTEIIIYAAIATIICVMLYSVLGKSVGRGPDETTDSLDKLINNPGNEPVRPVVVDPVIESGEFPELTKVQKADPSFTTDKFLDGAKGAYAMVLEAFAAGDRDSLKMLLSPHVYDVYDAAIKSREEKGLKQITDLARIIDAQITKVQTRQSLAYISVEFYSELASALVAKDGTPVEGDADILVDVREVWTFERNMKKSDPAWYLSDVAPADGGGPAVDPSPDTTAE